MKESMRTSGFGWLVVVGLIGAACGSDDQQGAKDGGDGSGGHSAGTGGRSAASGGRSASGGTTPSSGGRVTASGGTTPSGGAAPGSGGTASMLDGSVPDAPADASAGARDGGGVVLPSCARDHRTPAGRYRLAIHNVVREYDALTCSIPDCQCSDHTDTPEDADATLILEDYPTTLLIPPGPQGGDPTEVPVVYTYGRLEAPDTTLDTEGSHVEVYSAPTGLSAWLEPSWDPAQGPPNPYRLTIDTLGSSPPCGGNVTTVCPNPQDIVEIVLDTERWTVWFHRRWHRDGACGSEVRVTEQTGTGSLDCGDE